MEQKRGVLWPASRRLTVEHETRMICVAFQSLLNAPWTLEQLNAAWAKDLQPNLAHLTWRHSDFYAGFVHDNATDGALKQLLAGKWDGSCPTSSDRMLPICAFVCAVIVIIAIVIWRRRKVSTMQAREPLLNC